VVRYKCEILLKHFSIILTSFQYSFFQVPFQASKPATTFAGAPLRPSEISWAILISALSLSRPPPLLALCLKMQPTIKTEKKERKKTQLDTAEDLQLNGPIFELVAQSNQFVLNARIFARKSSLAKLRTVSLHLLVNCLFSTSQTNKHNKFCFAPSNLSCCKQTGVISAGRCFAQSGQLLAQRSNPADDRIALGKQIRTLQQNVNILCFFCTFFFFFTFDEGGRDKVRSSSAPAPTLKKPP
jgi:hypothetical protein